MALVTPVEVAAICRVRVTEPDRGVIVPVYDFSNGFDTVTPKGAVDGSPAIFNPVVGKYFLFLTDAIDSGSSGKQGGVVVQAVSTSAGNPGPVALFLTAQVAPDLSATPYAGVDPERVIGIDTYNDVGVLLDPEAFSVIVYRNPVTII